MDESSSADGKWSNSMHDFTTARENLVEYLWSVEKFQEVTRKTGIVNVEDLGWP